jgi:dihydroorotase
VVEQVWRRGVEAGYCDVHPVGAVTVGLKGEHLAELGAMADSAARVRVFSDDGVCVSDPVLMRRALEYVKAFDGVIAQHQVNPGCVADRLGRGRRAGLRPLDPGGRMARPPGITRDPHGVATSIPGGASLEKSAVL